MTRRRLLFLVAILLPGVLLYHGFTAWGAKNSHRRFLEAIENKDWPGAGNLISESYEDRFGFSSDQIILASRDVADQFFLTFSVEWTELQEEVKSREVVYTGRIRISGTGTPIAAEIVRASTGYLKEPLVFEWTQESFWPWSWRLRSVDIPGLELPSGYLPGDMELDLLDF